MSTDLLEGRIAELERRQSRIIPAREGADGWVNFVESRVAEESEFLRDVVAHALATMRAEISNEVKAAIDTALATRVRGTYQPGTKYARGDMVALDGGTFVARKDDPGPCPGGGGWQLMARQGQRGRDGPEGKRGPPGNVIVGWIVDRSNYRITPKLSDNSLGVPLELRSLFEPDDTVAR
jgi:hypothetical protein